MELPLDLFEEISGHLPVDKEATGDERREYRRFPIGSRGAVTQIKKGVEGPSSVALLRDVSLAGIGFLFPQALKAGEEFVLQMRGKEGRTIRVECVARRCEAGGSLEGTQFVVGATFEKVLDVKEQKAEETPSGPAIQMPPQQFPARLKPAVVAVPAAAAVHATPVMHTAPVLQPPAVAPVAPAVSVPAPAVSVAPVTSPAPVAPPRETVVSAEPGPSPASVAPQPNPLAKSAAELEKEMAAFCKPVETQPAPLVPPAAPTVTAAPGSAPAARNQEVLTRVRAMVLDQKNAIQAHAEQVEKYRRDLEQQTGLVAEIARQRDQLQALLAKADQQLTHEKENAVRQTETLRQDVADLQQAVRILQAKSDADDKAISELASLISSSATPPTGEPATSNRGNRAQANSAPSSETLVATLAVEIPA